MSRHISDSLHSCYVVMSTDEDQPRVIDIYVGFNEKQELVVTADYSNFENGAYNCSTAIVVSTEDGWKMARRNRVRYSGLPYFIAECMHEWGEIVNADLASARRCIKEIHESLLDEGCRTRIVRTYGRNEFRCC